MRILLHGFGTFALIWRHLIAHAQKVTPEVEWSIILQTDHHREVLRAVLPDERIFCLEHHQAHESALGLDLSVLATYPGNIHADIEAEKVAFKHQAARLQLARAVETYTLYKAFAQRMRPTHLLISQIEGFEGKMLTGLGHELGLTVMVPVNGRNLGGTFFASDAYETLPAHRAATPALMERARAFVARFRESPTSAAGRPDDPSADGEVLSTFRPTLPVRAARFARRAISRPDLFDREHLRTSVLNNLPFLRNRMWALHRWRAARIFDTADPAALPERFIYYPLQYTPESSINTPAPYYVDQLRVIDALRFAMPHDHMLVVKEHPACIVVRPLSFVRALQQRAGVVLTQYRMDSRMLARRASLTVSVSGSATLEAFLFGKPALMLGHSFITPYLGGASAVSALKERIAAAIASPPDDEQVATAVAEVMSVTYPFMFSAPGLPDEPVLRPGNIARMFDALRDHAGRVAAHGGSTARAA
jgi:hypothetical protein